MDNLSKCIVCDNENRTPATSSRMWGMSAMAAQTMRDWHQPGYIPESRQGPSGANLEVRAMLGRQPIDDNAPRRDDGRRGAGWWSNNTDERHLCRWPPLKRQRRPQQQTLYQTQLLISLIKISSVRCRSMMIKYITQLLKKNRWYQRHVTFWQLFVNNVK